MLIAVYIKLKKSNSLFNIFLSSAPSHLLSNVAYTFLKSTLYFKSPSCKSDKSGKDTDEEIAAGKLAAADVVIKKEEDKTE